MSDRWTVLALAHPRSGWYRELARWASTAALPIGAVVVASGAEAEAQLRSGRTFSVLLADATHPDLDADLIGHAGARGAVTFVVDGSHRRDWSALGAVATLPAELERDVLGVALRELATPVGDLAGVGVDAVVEAGPPPGRLVAVLGPGGTGASTVARALAQGLAGGEASVVLADLALRADQGMAHDVGDVVPGLADLVEAHRLGVVGAEEVQRLTWGADHLPYRLLLGLRRHRDWAALRERATRAAVASLRRAFDVVVADVDGDLEGEADTGSHDVEDRNRLARTAALAADTVAVVVRADLRGLHRLPVLVDDLERLGVARARIVPVLNGSPRRPDRRARLVTAVHELTGRTAGGGASTDTALAPPIHVPWRSDVAGAVLDGTALPKAMAAAVARALDAVAVDEPHAGGGAEPEPVVPGSLGTWWTAEGIGA